MALTDFVERPAIKAAFAEHAVRMTLPFDHRTTPLLVPSCGRRHSFVGTAFDYMARFRMGREMVAYGPEAAEVHDVGWVAELSVALMAKHPVLGIHHARWNILVRKGRELYRDFVAGKDIGIRRVAVCVQFMAEADLLFRAGKFNPACTEDPDVTEELLALDAAFRPLELFSLKHVCVLNPGFDAAGWVGGADGDIMVDDLIVDIKTTIHPALNPAHIRQLAGYAALQDIGGMRLSEETVHDEPVREIGIYYSRLGRLAKWRLDEVFPGDGFDRYLDAFVREARVYPGQEPGIWRKAFPEMERCAEGSVAIPSASVQ